MSIQLKKIRRGRKRFIKAPPFKRLDDWLLELSSLKEYIALSTSLQVVSSKSYLKGSHGLPDLTLMLEVIGKPIDPDKNAPAMLDLEAGESLVYKMGGMDLSAMDFEKLLATSDSIYKALLQKGAQLAPDLHLVFDGEKIELHFFHQKDYIQKLL